MRTLLVVVLFAALHALVGCGRNDSETPNNSPGTGTETRNTSSPKTFRYSPTVSQSDRDSVISNLETQVAKDTADLKELVQLSVQAEVFRKSLTPSQQLERLETFHDIDKKYKTSKDQLIDYISENDALLQLLQINDDRVDQIVATIRDAYRAKYAAKYDLAYVNELLTGRVHKPAEMLAYKISDHAVKGIQSRHSADHIVKSSQDLSDQSVTLIIDEIARDVAP